MRAVRSHAKSNGGTREKRSKQHPSQERDRYSQQKVDGVNGNKKGDVRRIIGSGLRKYTGSTKKETKGDAKLLNKTYLRDARVEYKREDSKDLPPCLDLGAMAGNWGLCDKLEPKATAKTDQKAARATDSIMAETEHAPNFQMADKTTRRCELTERGNYRECCKLSNYQNWMGATNWEKIPTPPQNTGRFAKWGKLNPIGRSIRADRGCKAYQDSDCDLKTTERSVRRICLY